MQALLLENHVGPVQPYAHRSSHGPWPAGPRGLFPAGGGLSRLLQ